MAKRKRTPEERAREEQFRRQSDENLQRLWRRIDQGWTELEERARREGKPPVDRPSQPVWADPRPR